MPLYALQCEQCGHQQDIYRSVAERNSDLPECCDKTMQRIITPLHVVEDVKPFMSPIDNKMVTSRKELREHCAKHDVVQIGNDRLPERKKWRPDKKEIREDIKKTLSSYGESYI